jgi:hypothetical protein
VLGLTRIADPEEKGDRLSVVLSDADSAKEKQEGRSRGNRKRNNRRRMKRRGGNEKKRNKEIKQVRIKQRRIRRYSEGET